MPRSGVAQGACRQLVDEHWTDEQVAAVVQAHDWTGARAGAVIAFLRGLTGDDKPVPLARNRARKRPEWCGACDEASRLLEAPPEAGDPLSLTRMIKCPTCHPTAGST